MNVRNILGIIVVIALAIGSISSIAGVAVAAPPGSISGTVYQADGTTPTPAGIVKAYDNVGTLVATAYTSGYDGSYTIQGLDPGDYRVMAQCDGYFSEYYDNATDLSSATPVAVTTIDTPGIDFTLTAGGFISGSVHSDNGTPIYSGHIMAFDNATREMVDETWMTPTSSDYRIGKDLPAGNYLVKVGAVGYYSEYYDNVTDPDLATPVTVTVPDETPGIDFTLTPCGSMSGSVYSDNGTPIYGAHVMAFDNVTHDLVDQVWMSHTSYAYRLGHDMPSGSYLVWAEAAGYISEYYDNVTAADYHNVAARNLATPVSVTVPNDTDNINFYLLPVQAVTTSATTNLATTSTTLNGTLTSMGTASSDNVSFEWGTTTSYGSETSAQSLSATGSFSDNLTGLSAKTTYHFRAKAVGDGTTYGDDATFTTSTIAPSVTTNAATNVATTSATLNGTLDSLGTASSDNVSFEWGLTTSYDYETTPKSLSATGSFSDNLTGLSAKTTYHFRAKAVGDGATYGEDMTFTTASPADTTAPVISVVNSSNITVSGATITWTTNEPANSQVECGLTASYGSSTTLDSNLVTAHSVDLTGLKANKTYHYRVISKDAANNQAVSADNTFTTAARSGGMPTWAWVLIGLAAVAVVGALGYFAFTKLAKN